MKKFLFLVLSLCLIPWQVARANLPSTFDIYFTGTNDPTYTGEVQVVASAGAYGEWYAPDSIDNSDVVIYDNQEATDNIAVEFYDGPDGLSGVGSATWDGVGTFPVTALDWWEDGYIQVPTPDGLVVGGTALPEPSALVMLPMSLALLLRRRA